MKLSRVTLRDAIPHPARPGDIKPMFEAIDKDILEITLEQGMVTITPVPNPVPGSPTRIPHIVAFAATKYVAPLLPLPLLLPVAEVGGKAAGK